MTDRAYNQKKITENIECEIFQVVLDEARESYNPEIVLELHSNSTDEMDSNLETIANWVKNWKQ